jgi:hypothetical protein
MELSTEKDRPGQKAIGRDRGKCGYLFILLMVFAWGLFFPIQADAFRYQNAEQGHDFTIIGLGIFRQNYTSTDGPEDLFEDSDDGLPEAYSNRSRLSIYGEGQIYNDYTFLLKSHYDEEAGDQLNEKDFTFLFELRRDQHFMILGDHEDGTFQDTVFTALDEQVRGVTLHAGYSKVGATIMAGGLRGETTTDEIRGDGTSGPYRLAEAPVIGGSETVTIEIRDRANPNRVIQRRTQARGRDYRVDYDDGEITFDRPVDEQDFRGNPSFIIVTYQFDSPGDRYKRAAWGTRITAAPTESVHLGLSYLADGPWEDSDTNNALDHRRQIFGADLALKITERYKFSVEVARSDIPELTDTLESDATVIDVDTNPVDPLRIYGRYWRVERDFLSFGNLNLQADNVVDEIDLDEPFSFKSASLEFDLDPNISVNHGTNEESYGLSAAYDINLYHTLSAGFRETKNDIPDEEDPQQTTRSLFASYKRIHPESTDWLLGFEKIDNENDEAPQTLDTTTNRLLGAVKHPVGTFRYIGDTYLQLAYQFEDFADNLTDENDTQIHDILGRVEFHPIQEVMVYGEQGEQYVYEKVEDDYTYRTDTSMVGVQGLFNRYADVDASVKFSREVDLIESRTAEKEQVYSIHWTSLPLDVLKTRLKFEYRETDDKIASRVRTRGIYGGELFWDIFSNLLATVKYEYEEEETKIPTEPGENLTYDDLTLRLDYKFRRTLSLFGAYRLENEELKAPPLSTTDTQTTTWLFGAKYQINDRWDVLSSYKYKVIEEAIEDKRQKFFAEVGYRICTYLKIALGYEYIDFIDEDTGEDFNTHVGYVSFIGNI